MSRAREKIPQLGFWDTEVAKPDHDDVCRWAYANAEMILRTICPEQFDRQWNREEVSLGHGDDEDRLDAAREFAKENPRPNPRVTKKTFEYVLVRHTGYQDRTAQIVGYADLLIESELPCIVPKYKPSPKRGGDDVFDGFIVSWCERLPNRYGRDAYAPVVLVEAKSHMPTLGELMRQIQLYRTAFGGKFVVVSPDDKFADVLVEQGVTFIKYAP